MFAHRYWPFALVIVVATTACGPAEEEPTPAPDPYPALEPADPLDLSAVDLGAGVRHGEPLALSHFAADEYAAALELLPHAVLHLQSYDERSRIFGEYHVSPAPTGVDARGPEQFIGEGAARARFEVRASDLYDEIATGDAEAGVDGFASTSIVLDFWRTRGDWYVRWDGNLAEEINTRGKGPYGFYRAQMNEDLLDQIAAVAAEHKPRYFIVGHEMERLYKSEDGAGLAPAEFSNFQAFYAEAVARIHEASPDTRVGAGINWDRFVARVAPEFDAGQGSSDAVLDRAFEAFVLPFAENGDVIALASYREPGEAEMELGGETLTVEQSYQFLRRIEPLYGEAWPIVWYSVGSPVESQVAYVKQRNYLEEFVLWTAGTNTEFVAWRALLNFDGTDTADQKLSGRCDAFVSREDFEMPTSGCFDGLFSSVFSPKEPFEHLREQRE